MKNKSKIEKFLRNGILAIKKIAISPWNKLKHLHNQIIQTDETALEKEVNRNPYQLFLDWNLDVWQFGALCTLLYSAFFGWQYWNTLILIYGFGVIPTIIKTVKRSLIGE